MEAIEKRDVNGDYKQWVADSYHCSGTWGQKMTELEMLIELAETRRQTDPGEYVPDITLYRECCEYWNQLCDAYRN
jgi:hypothetical protein